MNENVSKQGASGVTGVVYGFHEDANYKYLDVRVTAELGQSQILLLVLLIPQRKQISAVEDRLHVIDLKGTFTNDIPFKGYTSGETAQPTAFNRNETRSDKYWWNINC